MTQTESKAMKDRARRVPKKVGLSFKLSIICTLLLPLIQLSFNHLNKHFLSFNFRNLQK